MQKTTESGERFSELIAIMARLRGEKGCPWDKEQTHQSLKPTLLEETYEVLEAIDGENPKELTEELGDLLLQIVFHCQIARERGQFSIADVLSQLKEKLIRRHPHVFSDMHLPDADSVLKNWLKIKAAEKTNDTSASALSGVPKTMPALARAQRVTERASYYGFDWPGPEQVWKKVEEELDEIKTAVSSADKKRVKEEIGDLFFSLVNLSRFFYLQAEEALSQATGRFLKRFSHIEQRIKENGKTLAEASLEEMDALWDEAKKLERDR